MPKHAILAGTGIYDLPGLDPKPLTISTPFGEACYYRFAQRDMIFLARHGLHHDTPPHAINYRANFWALHQLGVEAAIAAYAVGSLHKGILPGELALLTDFIDHTRGRPGTFYDGGEWGVGHADMSRPYCPRLNQALLEAGTHHQLQLHPQATYICTHGPRLESPAEVRLLASWGGDVVGMTGVPEVALARELGIHFAGVALSMNLGIGLEEELKMVHDLQDVRSRMLTVMSEALQGFAGDEGCGCAHAVEFLSAPGKRIHRAVRG